MTLVEVIVAMAIVSIISLVVISSFTQITRLNQVATENKTQASQVEAQIAEGQEPAESKVLGDLKLDGFSLPSTVETYRDGRRSYSLIQGALPPVPSVYAGDGAEKHYQGKGEYTETGPGGGTLQNPYKVPVTGRYLLEVWGAKGGGNGIEEGLEHGGNGGYAAGIATLTEGEELYLYVGGVGTTAAGSAPPGGFNGGGAGASYYYWDESYYTGSGGGATDIRIGGETLYHRVIVAGGGGGAGNDQGNDNASDPGGAGGGIDGEDGKGEDPRIGGGGGKQHIGGRTGTEGSSSDLIYGPGEFGNGGHQPGDVNTGGGGGGGWYGGGSGSYGGGGGGSSWVFTEAAWNNWDNNTFHYSGDAARYELKLNPEYYLQETKLVAGNVPNTIPDPFESTVSDDGQVVGSTITGKSGGGFIRITWLGVA
jgi:type II secretory pathway pseudopilin PulG